MAHHLGAEMAKPTRSPVELRNMFGANLRVLSKKYPSISELARRLGINRTQFNRYLSGESFPRPDVLDRICSFFEVDARILLEPVANIVSRDTILNGPFLANFLGVGANEVPDELFPNGLYRFSRRSFTDDSLYVVGLVLVFRDHGHTFVRGFEAKEAMRQQGLPTDPLTREFRGFVTRQEDGIASVISRRNAMTCSFNYLSRVASFENNFWVGFVTRTVRESPAGTRAVRMVYEHLGQKRPEALAAARGSGLVPAEKLMPFHLRLLQPDEPFR